MNIFIGLHLIKEEELFADAQKELLIECCDLHIDTD